MLQIGRWVLRFANWLRASVARGRYLQILVVRSRVASERGLMTVMLEGVTVILVGSSYHSMTISFLVPDDPPSGTSRAVLANNERRLGISLAKRLHEPRLGPLGFLDPVSNQPIREDGRSAGNLTARLMEASLANFVLSVLHLSAWLVSTPGHPDLESWIRKQR